MKPELVQRLNDAAPLLSRGVRPYGWHPECGDGWYDLLLDLVAELERLAHRLDAETREHFYVSQVKEKYGTLRFYLSLSSDEMEAEIRVAEERSARTCEQCGGLGELRSTSSTGYGWLYTACDQCHKERQRA